MPGSGIALEPNFIVTKIFVARFVHNHDGSFVMPSVIDFTKALGDRTRWRIVRLAMTEPLCVCELADILEMPQSSVSSHVQIIRRSGILESEKAEKWTYFLVAPKYLRLIQCLMETFPGEDTQHEGDQARLQVRLEWRKESCCPGPKALKSRRTKSATIVTK